MYRVSLSSHTLSAPAAILLGGVAILFFVVVTATALGGKTVELPNRMAQMYGYTVCIISVIMGASSLTGLLDAGFDRTHPLSAEAMYGSSLSSFEAYKSMEGRGIRYAANGTQAAAPTEQELRRTYDALVLDRREMIAYMTSKKLATNGILLAFAIVLFALHWTWVRRGLRSAPPLSHSTV